MQNSNFCQIPLLNYTILNLLDNINTPQQLRELSPQQLPQLCGELREFIIGQLANNPGHLGSSLGVVELTCALHYVYNTPNDNLVWDVGHQAYAHKILTGRKDKFHTNRKYGGISGFPKRQESEYDAFGGGHASVSVSAALGMDAAQQLLGKKGHSVAIIGDGAMSGGLAFEGLNNAGFSSKDILVVLNDNDMSIDCNVGALNRYLVNISTSTRYNRLKNWIIKSLTRFPRVNRFLAKLLGGIKWSLLTKGNLFTSLGFRYFGVVDGHDVERLVDVLNSIKELEGAKLLHIVTKKGKGYAPAENNQTTWHAPGKFNPETGQRAVCDNQFVKYQDVFGQTLLELAQQNSTIIGVTPAMPTGCSMDIMQQQMPDRVFDVGIAEGHAVTFSGGAAAAGLLPFCNIYSTFMQRAYDNLIHDVVLQGVDVVFCLDRSGIVGEDGATHHGSLDVACYRSIPGVTIAAPSSEMALRNLMYTAQLGGCGAFIIRYPRGYGHNVVWRTPMQRVLIGKSETVKSGSSIAILALGTTVVDSIKAAKLVESSRSDISVEIVDLVFAKPLDTQMLDSVASRFSSIITVEDGVVVAGVGSAVVEYFADKGYTTSVTRLGMPDTIVQHGSVEQLKHDCGYDVEGIEQAILNLVG